MCPSGHVIYARGSELYAIPFDPDELCITGEAMLVQQGIREPGPGAAADYAVSDSGTLAWIPGDGASALPVREIVWVGRDGRVIETAIAEGVAAPSDVRLSPNNTQLVLTSGRGLDGEIWLYNFSGRPAIPLNTVGVSGMPVWSPDGREIAFVSNRGGNFALYRVPADGSEIIPTPFDRTQPAGAPAVWTDNGELILMRPESPTGADILMTRLDGDAAYEDLVVTPNDEFDPALSPSGRWLAYVSNRTENAEVWVMRYPDGPLV